MLLYSWGSLFGSPLESFYNKWRMTWKKLDNDMETPGPFRGGLLCYVGVIWESVGLGFGVQEY